MCAFLSDGFGYEHAKSSIAAAVWQPLAATRRHRRRGRQGLPQFQCCLSRRCRHGGGRLHGGANPRHRRAGAIRRHWRAGFTPTGLRSWTSAELEVLCRARSVDEVVFAYSDVPHEHVMHVASRRSRPAPTSHCSDRSGPCSRRPCRSSRSRPFGPVAESPPSRAGCRSGCGNAKSVARSRANMRWSSLTAMDRR